MWINQCGLWDDICRTCVTCQKHSQAESWGAVVWDLGKDQTVVYLSLNPLWVTQRSSSILTQRFVLAHHPDAQGALWHPLSLAISLCSPCLLHKDDVITFLHQNRVIRVRTFLVLRVWTLDSWVKVMCVECPLNPDLHVFRHFLALEGTFVRLCARSRRNGFLTLEMVHIFGLAWNIDKPSSFPTLNSICDSRPSFLMIIPASSLIFEVP